MHDAQCRVCGNHALSPANLDVVTPILAGWWSRVGATLIDAVIFVVPTFVLVLTLGSVLGGLASIVAQAIYTVTLQTRADGQTIGNRVARTRVRDALSGHVISRSQALVRWAIIASYNLLASVSSPKSGALVLWMCLFALADCLYPLFNERKQTLHDRIARTIVVRA